MYIKELIEFNENTENNEELVDIWRTNTNTITKYTEWDEKVLKIRKECIVKPGKQRKRKKTCISKNLNILQKARERVKNELKKSNDEDEKKLLKVNERSLNVAIENETKIEESKKRIKVISDLEKNGGISSGSFWQVKKKMEHGKKEMVCAIKTVTGKMITEKEEMKKEYIRFYKELLNVCDADDKTEKMVAEMMEQIKKLDQLKDHKNIERTEFEEVTSKLKKNKARDLQGWENEMIIYGGEKLQESLMMMINEIRKTALIPDEWKEIKIKSLYKNKGSIHELKNRRGIFISSVPSKLVEKIILNENDEVIDSNTTESQCGGKKGRGTSDQLFITYRIIEYHNVIGQDLNILFVDAEKCFGKLWL